MRIHLGKKVCKCKIKLKKWFWHIYIDTWFWCCELFSKKWLFPVLNGEPLQWTVKKPSDFLFSSTYYINAFLCCKVTYLQLSKELNCIWIFFLADIQSTSLLCQVQSVYLNGIGNTASYHLFKCFFFCRFHCCSDLIIHDLMYRSVSWL